MNYFVLRKEKVQERVLVQMNILMMLMSVLSMELLELEWNAKLLVMSVGVVLVFAISFFLHRQLVDKWIAYVASNFVLFTLLDMMDINYEIDTKLVRGLDYYNHTVFEVVLNNSYALGGGGRYNGLVETLGGPSIPGVGFAMGYDRTMLAMEEEGVNVPINNSIDVYLLYVSDNEKETAAYLAQDLRLNGFITETDLMKKSLKAQFKSVERYNAKYLIVLNDEELKENRWSWGLNVKEPFENCLDKLYQCGFLKTWKYCYLGGIEITDEEVRAGAINSYEKFTSLLVKFELNDFEEPETRAIEIREKKAQAAKKLQTKHKNAKRESSDTARR